MATYIDEYTQKGAKRLVKFGFCKEDAKSKYEGKTPEQFEEEFQNLKSDVDREKKLQEFEKDADVDWVEVQRDQLISAPYPKPISRYYLTYESFHEAIEPIYFWCLNHATFDWGFPVVHKITDIFTASEHSSFYGASASRLGLAQDKVSQFLATIGRMTKDLFSLVRELRIIDERFSYYKDIFEQKAAKTEQEKKENENKRIAAEIVIKGLWVDLVDGVVQGQRSAANLFSMAQQLQFVSLPAQFFKTHPKSKEDVVKVVEATDANRTVKTALIRKIEQYLAWRDATYDEMKNRRKFTLDYLSQHYETIRMYIQWVKPYLKHIERLSGATQNLNRAELVSSFEGSLIEIEFLAQKLASPKNKKVFSCMLMTFEYRTRPQLSYQAEGGRHQGPLHVGETKITWRSYAWTQKQIENYIALKEYEDMELIATIDRSLTDAMEALGVHLQNYLKEKRQEIKESKEGKKEEKTPEGQSVWAPFLDVVRGFKDLGNLFLPQKKAPAKQGGEEAPSKDDAASASGAAKFLAWQHYKNFKKAHGMVAW